MTTPIEPIDPYSQPASLYKGRDWIVDGSTPDTDTALDVGYHNPKQREECARTIMRQPF